MRVHVQNPLYVNHATVTPQSGIGASRGAAEKWRPRLDTATIFSPIARLQFYNNAVSLAAKKHKAFGIAIEGIPNDGSALDSHILYHVRGVIGGADSDFTCHCVMGVMSVAPSAATNGILPQSQVVLPTRATRPGRYCGGAEIDCVLALRDDGVSAHRYGALIFGGVVYNQSSSSSAKVAPVWAAISIRRYTDQQGVIDPYVQ